MSLSAVEEYIETGNYQDLDLLLSQSPEEASRLTSHGISPLLLACYFNKMDIIKILLKYLKKIDIHEACAVGLYKEVEMMLSNNPQAIEEISKDGFTPLGIASHFGQSTIVRLLLTSHANPNAPSQNGFFVYPIHSALSNGYNEIAKMLLEAGAEVNVLQAQGNAPIHIAAQQGNIDILILLLEKGADVSAKNEFGETASELAYEKGFKEIAEILK